MEEAFCDTCCMFCDSPGQHYVNFAKYHRICDTCPCENSTSQCKHCKSSVKITSKIEKTLLTEENILITSSLRSIESKNSSSNPVKSSCFHCKKEDTVLEFFFCSHFLCNFCYFIFSQEKTYPLCLTEFEKKCELCFSDFYVTSCTCNTLLCESCYSKDLCRLNKHNAKICNLCFSLMENEKIHQSIFACFKCLDRYPDGIIKKCDSCNLGYPKNPIRTTCSLCKECQSELEESRRTKPICEICNERSAQDIPLECSHRACIYCSHPSGYCLKCRLVKFKYSSNDLNACHICNSSTDCYQLFCNHYTCKKCIKRIGVKRLNYCCTECFSNVKKHCAHCKKISEISKSGGIITKKCCSRSYCSNCYKKPGFFYHRCNM